MSEKNLNDHTDPTWKMHMETLMMKKRIIETKEIINQAIWEYYFEKGLPVPKWRMEKDPQWWLDYLEELKSEGEK